MSRLENISSVFLIGIGGIGMSALARFFNSKGVQVSGYDRVESPVTDALQKEGIQIQFEDNPQLIPSNPALIIYTPAIPESNKILSHFREAGYEVLKRAQVLGELSKGNRCIAIGGSHGKTTVSAMIAHLLHCGGEDVTAFLGGISNNLKSNFLTGNSELMLMEADEYDRSFLQLFPHVAVITAVDSDHLDIYGDIEGVKEAFAQFANQTDHDGLLIHEHSIKLFADVEVKTFSYSLSDTAADLYVNEFHHRGSIGYFRTNDDAVWELPMGGVHNIENALAAIAVCRFLGMEDRHIARCLAEFSGIYRRFQKVFEGKGYIYFDDYAHHPKEIKAFIESLRLQFPGKRIAVAFQPHLFSRTKDLAVGFAESLRLADELFLLPIYPARELPQPGVSSALISDLISDIPVHLVEKDELAERLINSGAEILATVGAGDIDRLVEPIGSRLKKSVK